MSFLLLFASAAWASPADDRLAQVDAASNQAADAHLNLSVVAVDEKGRESERTLELWQKGDDKRLVRFQAPPRLAGTAMLVPDGDTVYLYLPAYGRARRIVGESRGDAFVGTDFSIDDLSRLSWADEYAPTLIAPDHLSLRPKEGVKTGSARVELYVGAEDHLPRVVEHYDANDALLRRIRFDDVRDIQGRPLAHSLVVEDVKSGRTTRATVTDVQLDTGLDDGLFTITQLQR